MAKYRIMTFDGGGIRGSLTSSLILRIEQQFPGLLASVDLFAGTSTGSMIALQLAYGRTAQDLVEVYSEENMKFIFGHPRFSNLTHPKHDNKNLIALMQKVFPDNPTMGQLKRHVMVPTFQVDDTTTNDWEAVFMHNFPDSNFLDVPIIDAGLASAAAPTFFAGHRIPVTGQVFIDGGVMANNPSTAAIAVALAEGKADINDVCLLSIGTGLVDTIIQSDPSNWGIMQWMINPFHEPHEALLGILFDGVSEADCYTSSALLGQGQRYCRVNPPIQQTILDDWQAVPTMIAAANAFNMEPVFHWIETAWLS